MWWVAELGVREEGVQNAEVRVSQLPSVSGTIWGEWVWGRYRFHVVGEIVEFADENVDEDS